MLNRIVFFYCTTVLNEDSGCGVQFIVQCKITMHLRKIWMPYKKYIIFTSSIGCLLKKTWSSFHSCCYFDCFKFCFFSLFYSSWFSVIRHSTSDWCYTLLISVNISSIHCNIIKLLLFITEFDDTHIMFVLHWGKSLLWLFILLLSMLYFNRKDHNWTMSNKFNFISQ